MSEPTATPSKTNHRRGVVNWGVAVIKAHVRATLGLLSAVVTGLVVLALEPYITDWFRFTPYVAVIRSEHTNDLFAETPSSFWEGFDATSGDSSVAVEAFNDLGDPQQAEAILRTLLDDPQCLMIVGATTSTLTDQALETIASSKDPPLYVMALATATELTAKARRADLPVLRLIPDNAAQAEHIIKLIYHIHGRADDDNSNVRLREDVAAASQDSTEVRIAVYTDESNPVYGYDLAREIAHRLRQRDGRISEQQPIGSTNSALRSLKSLSTEQEVIIDAIVYIGNPANALLLMDQMSHSRVEVPVIFTEGAAVPGTMDYARKSELLAYILSPVPYLGDRGDRAFHHGYTQFGMEAASFLLDVVADCEGCRRSELRRAVELDLNGGDLEHISSAFPHIAFTFNSNMENVGMGYIAYEVTTSVDRVSVAND